MQWLTPAMALYAAAVTVPLLVLLYFLKLKRTERVVSSTLLWQRAVQDLQVNAPFQRLRRNILLLLQLLAMLAALVALAGPVLNMNQGAGQRYVILIDRSASMNSTDGDGSVSRLDDAVTQARTFVESLRNKAVFSLKDRADQAMVIAFDEHAKIMCNFTSDKSQLRIALKAITPTDRTSLLAETLTVARAFTQPPGVETNNRTSEQRAQLHLFSDGRIKDLEDQTMQEGELVYHRVGASSDNVAITAMQARRSYEQTDQIQVFASLAHFGETPVTCDVQVSVNQDIVAVRAVTLTPARADANGVGVMPGRASVEVTVTYDGAGLLEVRHLHADCLRADDAAWTVIAPPKQLNVALVTAGNPVLASVFQACPLASFKVLTAEAFDEAMASVTVSPYDVTVLDNTVPERLPRGRYLVFGAVPEAMGMTVAGSLENQFIVDWRPNHAILKHVNPSNVYVAKAVEVVPPREARVLAQFNSGPAIVLAQSGAGTFVWVGFDCLKSNWPFEPSFVLFCYNVMDYLGMQVTDAHAAQLSVGEPILIRGLVPNTEAQLSGPTREDLSVTTDEQGSLRFPGTDRVGAYTVTLAGDTPKTFAVNLLNTDESRVTPMTDLVLSGQTVSAQETPVGRANQPLWPLAVIVALAFVCLEWWVYNSKMRI
ncbi:MAG: VWA domain-containing protein [Phycisphaeraceae bacterium]|nr:VWA domain-containing protein [Phycisphaeraceae bacterium]